MLKRFIVFFAVVIATASTFTTTTGCGTGGGGGTGGSGGGMDAGTDPDLVCDASPPATSFAKVYSDIITPSCLGTCHKTGAADGSDSYGVYTTETDAFKQVGKASLYMGAAKILKIVDPNKLDNSSMFMKVLGKSMKPGGGSLGGQMPLGAAALTATQKTLLKDWICSGAKP